MIVVDASVAYKWWDKKEPLSEEAKIILTNNFNNTDQILVPDLILYELANAWATKTKFSPYRVKNNLKDLEEINLSIEPVSLDLIRKAIAFSRRYKVTVYDATYVILAKGKKCKLVTADDKFVMQVKLPFVKHLSEY